MNFPDFFGTVRNGRTRYWRLWAMACSAEVAPRSGERVRSGRYPFPVKGIRGTPGKNFENLYANMCILSAFKGKIWICDGCWQYGTIMISLTFLWLKKLPWLFQFSRKVVTLNALTILNTYNMYKENFEEGQYIVKNRIATAHFYIW